MRKLTVLAAAIALLALFATVSRGEGGSSSGGAAVPQIDPSRIPTLDAHPLTAAEGQAAGAVASRGGSPFGLIYLAAQVTMDNPHGFVNGGAIRCPRRSHPISGFFAPDDAPGAWSTSVFNAPLSQRKWAVLVYTQEVGNIGPPPVTQALVGVVCEKGIPVR